MLSILETESHNIYILSSRSGLTFHTALYVKTMFLDTISEADFCITRLRHSGMRILLLRKGIPGPTSRTFQNSSDMDLHHPSLKARKFLTWAEIGARDLSKGHFLGITRCPVN